MANANANLYMQIEEVMEQLKMDLVRDLRLGAYGAEMVNVTVDVTILDLYEVVKEYRDKEGGA